MSRLVCLPDISPLTMVSIANPDGEQGMAQYTVMIDANSKVIELSATSGDPLVNLNSTVRAITMPQTFPDTTLKKLPRLSTIACMGSNQACTFTLLSASRVAPLN